MAKYSLKSPNSTLHVLECGHNDCPPAPGRIVEYYDVFAANGLLEPKS